MKDIMDMPEPAAIKALHDELQRAITRLVLTKLMVEENFYQLNQIRELLHGSSFNAEHVKAVNDELDQVLASFQCGCDKCRKSFN